MDREYIVREIDEGMIEKEEIVRCKDCMKNSLCIMFHSSKNPEGYCCWAERKEE